ncbi:Serine/threonine-protein phosphatase PP1 [Echinococcus granulosus]|uniref:Serine/threonine-protein phosphatase PP1 n=1 Tax=Echinococcus granulosus TaxID=6210 RepID=W6ULJ8_ECHGR|nr:Serine/threonine-protein phosphatase PP1 [Echinococcus granulosus]EUB62001.1 Serine/threonine-protein phosphatase PP1 [Echinococcus granulosus]
METSNWSAFVKYELLTIIRAHQLLSDGYRFVNPRILSIFSAPKYMNRFENNGAVVAMSKTNRDRFLGVITSVEPANINYVIPFME